MPAKSWKEKNKGWGILGHPELRALANAIEAHPKNGKHWRDWTDDDVYEVIVLYGNYFRRGNSFYTEDHIEPDDQLRDLILDRVHENWIDTWY